MAATASSQAPDGKFFGLKNSGEKFFKPPRDDGSLSNVGTLDRVRKGSFESNQSDSERPLTANKAGGPNDHMAFIGKNIKNLIGTKEAPSSLSKTDMSLNAEYLTPTGQRGRYFFRI
jgi:hypothetical protein